MFVLGEKHFETKPGTAPSPSWRTIAPPGLYTGVMQGLLVVTIETRHQPNHVLAACPGFDQ